MVNDTGSVALSLQMLKAAFMKLDLYMTLLKDTEL